MDERPLLEKELANIERQHQNAVQAILDGFASAALKEETEINPYVIFGLLCHNSTPFKIKAVPNSTNPLSRTLPNLAILFSGKFQAVTELSFIARSNAILPITSSRSFVPTK